jgi:hypothetical protein
MNRKTGFFRGKTNMKPPNIETPGEPETPGAFVPLQEKDYAAGFTAAARSV